jgi:hypothetical protein
MNKLEKAVLSVVILSLAVLVLVALRTAFIGDTSLCYIHGTSRWRSNWIFCDRDRYTMHFLTWVGTLFVHFVSYFFLELTSNARSIARGATVFALILCPDIILYIFGALELVKRFL